MLLLVNYRPEYSHPWGNESFYTELRLNPLPPETAGELLDTLLGSDPSLTTLKQLLATRTAGNPLFVEEGVRALVETSALDGERGAYRLTRAVETVEVPPTVQAILASRIDGLPRRQKSLLQCAAVIGHEIPQTLLAAVSEDSEEECRRGLADLHVADFLYNSSTFPEAEYSFKHALTHEVAYASLLRDRRRELHGRTVDAIRGLYGERGGGHTERLAFHAVQAERWPEAVRYLRQAAERAAMRSAHRQAVVLLDEARTALGHLENASETSAQAIDVCLALRHSLLPLGEFQRTIGHLQEARALAERLGDPTRLAWVSAYLSVTSTNTGNAGNGVSHAMRAIEVAEREDDPILLIAGNYYLGLALMCLGAYTRAANILTRNISLTPRWRRDAFAEPGQPSVYNRAWLTFALAELGQFDAAQRRARETARIAQEGALDDRFTLCHGHFAVGVACLMQGVLAEATTELEQCATICRDAAFPMLLTYLAPFLGSAWTAAGRADEAIGLLGPIVRQAPSSGLLGHQPFRELALGEAYLAAGRSHDAAEVAAHAVNLARTQGERGSEAWALRLWARFTSRVKPRSGWPL
jgi:tetratricopeptide (TPR) repeat protein